MYRSRNVIAVFFGLLLAIAAGPAPGEASYPNRPIRFLVSFPAGGGVDLIARLFANQLGPILGQPVVIENRGGASGLIAGKLVAQSEPDGYTILVATNSMIIGQLTNPGNGIDIVRDLRAVASVAPQANIIVARPDLQVDTLQDLVELAKKQSLTYASPGTGSVPQLFFEHLFTQTAKAPMVHVPFTGAAPALTAIMSGQTDVGIVTLPPAVALVATKKIKGLAVTTPERAAGLTGVPTAIESGYPSVSSTVWTALFVPSKTPVEIASRLSDAMLKIAAMPEIRTRLLQLGYETTSIGAAEFHRNVADELRMWTGVIGDTSKSR
jgi:tripartite-type tricarboxylate transporter receptor subunit TctC